MSICSFCGKDPAVENVGPRDDIIVRGHGCHCVYERAPGRIRVAWGICCARETVGPALMEEEDESDRKTG